MIYMLEQSKSVRKMIHAPSLNIYKIQKVCEEADTQRQQIYTILNAWKRLHSSFPDNIIGFDNVYYVSSQNSVQICLNHTRKFPLKVP